MNDLNDESKYPLQYMLYSLMQKTQAMSSIASQANVSMADKPSKSLKLAMAVAQKQLDEYIAGH